MPLTLQEGLANDDLELPAHLRRELAPMRPTTGDPVARRIAFLLRLHPDVDREYEGVDLRRVRPADRRAMLEAIERRLAEADPCR